MPAAQVTGGAGARVRRRGRATLVALLAAACLAPAAARAGDTTRFLVIGHLRGDATGALWPWLDVLVDDARRLEPDLVFLTGDLVWGDYNASPVDADAVEADWERLDAALARIGAPVLRVPGNHDTNDPVTRALFERRYGELPRAVRHGDDVFVLVDSTRTDPAVPPRVPRPHARVEALPEPRIRALRRVLAEAAPFRHGFVFLHHVLWWEEDAPWWREVHPLLRDAGVRAVFAGDFGPVKLSHVARDGVAYWQSAVEGPTGMRLLRRLEGARLLHVQLDTFLEVRVSDAGAEVVVHPVALEESGRLTPAYHRRLTTAPQWTLRERIDRTLGGPLRRTALAAAGLGLLALGWLLGRLRRR